MGGEDDPVAAAEAVISALSPLVWWKFDEGAGDTVTDYGSAGADLTLAAAGAHPTWVSSGLSFDGNDHATAGPITYTGTTASMVWAAAATSVGGGGTFLYCHGDIQSGVDTCSTLMGYGTTAGTSFRLDVSDNGDQDDATHTELTENDVVDHAGDAWHTLGWNWDGSVATLYVDGAAEAAPTNSGTATGIYHSTDTFALGGLWSNNAIVAAVRYQGLLGYMLIFDGELTAQQMSDLHDALSTIMSARGITLP